MSIRTNKVLTRESNIELLRIVLMMMIIGYHLIVHGANVGGPDGSYEIVNQSSAAYVFLKSFLVIAVNCFVFISGFFGIRFKIKPFLSLILQATFYALAILSFADLLFLDNVGLRAYLHALFPVLSGLWWFITAYIALYIISPLLNNAVDSFDKNQLLFIVISLTIINIISGFVFTATPMGANRGFSVISFIHIYLLARYIKKYADLKLLEKYAALVYLVSSLLIFLLAYLSVTELDQRGIFRIFAYNNPLVLVSAVSFFFLFKSFSFHSRIINSISPYVLGVYLYHDHPLTREYLIEYLYTISKNESAYLHFLNLLLITLMIFLAGLLIDKFRYLLLNPMVDFLVVTFKLGKIDSLFSINKNSTAKKADGR